MRCTTPRARCRHGTGRAVALLAAVTIGAATLVAACSTSRPPVLVVSDLSRTSGQDQITFASLEGLANRGSPRLYLTGITESTAGLAGLAASKWLHLANRRPTETLSPLDAISRFRGDIRGLVVWDPGLLVDTENVATTLAGMDDALPVSPETARTLEAAPFGFRVLVDLRDEHFRSRNDAYLWALARGGAGRHFAFPAWIGDVSGDGKGAEPLLRDWVVQQRGFAFEANPSTEASLMSTILAYFPADTPVYGYVFYSDDAYKKSKIAVLESVGVTLVSRLGDFLVPTDTAANLSFLSQTSAPAPHPPWKSDPVAPDPNQVYVTFVISDGDNVGADEAQLLVNQWDDPARGRIPMGVSLSVQLWRLEPAVYSYYVHTMTADDVFVAAASGQGYAYPSDMPDMALFLERSRDLMASAGLHGLWILDNGYAASPGPATVAAYAAAVKPSGIFTDYLNFQGGLSLPNPPAISFADGVPVVHDIFGLNVSQTVSAIRSTASAAGGRPAFVFVGLNTWTMGYSAALDVMNQLGPGFRAVRPDTFIGLLDGAQAAGEIPPGESTP